VKRNTENEKKPYQDRTTRDGMKGTYRTVISPDAGNNLAGQLCKLMEHLIDYPSKPATNKQ
jgi:hypothetical protein